MAFKLSTRSMDRLIGVDERLVTVVKLAIHKTKIDFGVICGMGNAVDLMAYIGSRSSWELNLYDDIASAMAESAREVDVPLRWGAAWTVPNIAYFDGTMEDAMNSYIDTRRTQGRRPFIDGPHFELML